MPLRIECYDVSNLQGTEVVASMVVFEDGLARKSEYRRFVIKGVDGQNDVASMHEVITRRFRRLLDEQARSELRPGDDQSGPMLVDPETGRPRKFAYAPGLVVVDGGPPQVAAAQRALDELGIVDIPVVGLAKRLEEVWVPGQEDPVILRRSSRGALPAPADPRRGAPVRDHPPPLAAVQVDGREPARRRRRASARCGARRCSSTSARSRSCARPSVDEIAQVPGIGPATAAAIKDAVAGGHGTRQTGP